jgi:7,8-dihydroneopterin 2',3'-cyclic phosphate phosphodiesterase
MEKLIELSKKIKDDKLRKMVVDFLKDLKLSNKNFSRYPKMDIKDAATMFTVGGPGGSSTVERDVLNHTITLTKLCEKVANTLKNTYGLPLNRDNMIAAAILHDLMKVFEWRRGPHGLEHTGIMLDHTMLGVAELYHRGFPEDVIHIVASHFGENGPTPPRNFEALIFHHLDNMISIVEFRMYASNQDPLQLLLLDEETMKKLGEESEKTE